MIEKIRNRIIEPSCTLINALKVMDEQKVKILFVFEKEKFIGMLTIGDIQRAIIKGSVLTSCVENIIDNDKVFGHVTDSSQKIKDEMYRLRAECMPILNENGDIVDVLFWTDVFLNTKHPPRELIDLPVVIMAGGKGTRMRPLTNVIPKPLLPIGEKTIIERIMDQFEGIGCHKFYLSVNYKYEIIKFYLRSLCHNYDITFFQERKPMGTIGSVSLLNGKITTPFFVSNCDTLIDQDFRDVYDYHVKNNNDITIITTVKSLRIPYGVIETGDNGLLKAISEKPENAYMINTGVYIMQPDLINRIPENEHLDITDLIKDVMNSDGKVGCFPVSERSWTDIGDWDQYLKRIRP